MLSAAERWSRLCSVTHTWMPGIMALEQAQFVVMRSYRPRRNGYAFAVAKEFTRRGVRSDDAGHQPPGRRQCFPRRVGVRGEVPDNPCQARDGFGSGDDIENTTTEPGATGAH